MDISQERWNADAQKVTLACAQCGSRNYTAAKQIRRLGERRMANKFCSTCNKHTIHRETE
ncbi:50S ribosomal protein L33 [Geobacillus proteiniphilus]|uniref:Large ribosomal subunit protein bL33 n=1 Tax=Geobacillus proteiniphilus TaxID=860353 RepID=A0A1Q5T1X6_9BACL|nr:MULTISPECIES: 50S ribosomal protein L33 [Geobacillus]OKO94192.1 LSU ribosomal protein L33p [Geobacillus proteiniphilus]OPX03478.1 50S ribosomal protein L33 [Geobacillus sp. LEMMY01]WMJ16105.1 50S ribosomal protein L33 [Geobacillus proteiniphilus]